MVRSIERHPSFVYPFLAFTVVLTVVLRDRLLSNVAKCWSNRSSVAHCFVSFPHLVRPLVIALLPFFLAAFCWLVYVAQDTGDVPRYPSPPVSDQGRVR